ncbi:MAG: nucleotide sugar dehydrogenase [Candidatus Thorarchaeota archaeon]
MTGSNLAVVGLGYVGVPVAAKFAESGLNVVGIDLLDEKVDLINSSRSPIEGDEPGLDELLEKVVTGGKLKASTDFSLIQTCDYVLIVVQTPFDMKNQKPFYGALRSAAKSVGENLKKGALVIIESTVAPGTTTNIIKPLLEEMSGLEAGADFMLATAPERVMPGKLLHNLVNLDRVVGGIDEKSADAAVKLYQRIVKGELHKVDTLTAEVVKTTENAYRDVQIAFANEVALLCENMDVDVFIVRDLVNRTPARHMHLPGAGVGGHCIPKDSWLLAFGARGKNEPRLIALAREINDGMPAHMSDLCEEALRTAGRDVYGSKVTILGAAYLEDSDDTRNTPAMPLMRNLEVLGVQVSIHDPHVKNMDGISPLKDIYEAVRDSDCIAIVTGHNEYKDLDLDRVKNLMRTPIFVDGRNILDGERCQGKGFAYWSVGRPPKFV